MADPEKSLPGALTNEALFQNPYVARYERDIIYLAKKANRWRTNKARNIELLRFFPPEYRIEQTVFHKEDEQEIRTTMLNALEEGYRVGFRTCPLHPELGKAKWLMNLGTEEEVGIFFNGSQNPPWVTSEENPLKGYSELLNDPNIVEVIIVANPPGLGLEELDHKHLVAGITFLGNQLTIEVLPQTSQQRDLSRKTPFHIKMDLGERIFSLQKGSITIDSSNKDYYLPDGETLKPEISGLAKQISEAVFEKWWNPPFHIAYRLKALENIADIKALELQGCYEQSNLKYLLIYGFKGIRS